MAYLYNDYYDLVERFAIMTTDEKTPADKVFNYLRDKTTPELLNKLKSEYQQPDKKPAETPAGIETYFINNIALYPCNENGQPLVKIYDEQHNVITDNQIKDAERLHQWETKNITRFSFIPAHNNLVILDLDNNCDAHANKTNGVDNFIKWTSTLNLNTKLKGYLENFPHNFPCYVKTPHGGIHLYFNDAYITDEIKRGLDIAGMNARNIEIKYNTQVTAGGSVRNGKEYILQGNIKDAPRLTLDLLNAMTKDRPKPRPAKSFNKDAPAGAQWNKTPDGIINKAMELYSNETPHQFIYKTAILFQRAGFTKADAELYIKQTPQHLGRKDQADTDTAINSIFN